MTKRKKVLLIDDNDDTIDLLEVFLFEDYDLLIARNGYEGLTVSTESQPDCIITDIMMPVMDGIRFFNELKRRESTMHIPVIAFTAFSEPSNAVSLMNIGFNAVLTKPFDRQVIQKTIGDILSKKCSRQQD